jgi:hypothetical protein
LRGFKASKIAVDEDKMDEFWDQFYEGGKKKVTNTNPKTKEKYPEVSAHTLFQNDVNFRRNIMKEFKEWSSKQKEDNKDTKDTKKDPSDYRNIKVPKHVQDSQEEYTKSKDHLKKLDRDKTLYKDR